MVITPEVKVHLQKIRTLLQQLETFTQDSLQEALAQYLEDESIRFKVIAQPIRVAITGRKASPGLFETMEVLGQDSVVQRMAMVTE
jgi:glutamyl-tRNA synthetase